MISLILIVTIVSMIILLVLLTSKIKENQDYSILGSILSRLYLLFILTRILHGADKSTEIIIGLLIVIISDILANIMSKITKKYENELLANKYYTVLNNSLAGVYTINTKGDFEYVNKKTCEIFTMPKEVMLTSNMYKLLSESDAIEYKRSVDKILSTDETYFCVEIDAYDYCKNNLRLMITGNKTVNGHETITGSILII
jgi:PAS domain-containing protein